MDIALLTIITVTQEEILCRNRYLPSRRHNTIDTVSSKLTAHWRVRSSLNVIALYTITFTVLAG